jgi:hypothetical protein
MRCRNASAASFSRSRLFVMLALKSRITTTVNGCVSFWKNVIFCGLPLSKIVN